ncbi:fimbria/pilus outer membrane usher protein [Duganella sp. CT11-25]|uniref:fimbria/pilus outer membrane usher protein n=1 Tax=unclassified Duganella TaxID=2636909 RepID=UPI0039AF3AC3
MWRRLICLTLLAWMAVGEVGAQTPAAPPPQEEELFLEVSLNGEVTGLILRFTRGKTSGLRSSVQNLRDLELDPKLFGVEGWDAFDLDQVKGLGYAYDAARQSIALRVADALRAPVALSGRAVRQTSPAVVTPGAVINYDAFTRLGQDASLSLANEVRYFNAGGVLTSTGVFNYSRQLRQFIRFDTAWVHADPETLETWQVGDLISSSLTWSRSLRMGGVQWRKSFDLRPDLLTFPAATLAGSAVVPSAVSLYINGVRQVETAVPSGPFVINQVSSINGAGQATLVTRDSAGRAVSTTVPLYVDTRMLAEDLTDYSVELGVLRRRYTTDSFGYARTPALSASLRRGISDSFTLEAHGEAGQGVVNGGVGALLRLGQAGVVSAALAGSGGDGRGGQATVGYQYLSPRFSIDVSSQRASPRYSDLGTRESGGGTLASDRVNFNLSLWGGQGVGLSLVNFRAPLLPPARIAALSYTASLGLGLYLSASAFRDMRDDHARGVFFSLSGSFGDRISANASRGRQNGVQTTSMTLQRSADYGGGFGWGLQSVDTNGSPLRQAQATYLGNYGQLTALTQENASTRSTSLDAAGALVLMDGSVHAARQVGAGFALVSTDGVGGVPVLQENRVIGKTGGSGYLLVPNLNPYLANQVAIDTSALPLDARIASTRQTVVPARLSGVLAHFPVEQYQAASVILHGADGKPLAAGTEVLHVESGAVTVVGFDGVAFIDHLAPLNHLRLNVGGARCMVEFPYVQARGQAMSTIGPFVCRSVQ